ncbi:hypothetical protein [Rhodopirellula bahusiensis]|uniref:hypothetical protein n=1 Tax=Rhodopirellula bahusiensis TaxID=2014065 RepID=UPI003263C070
MTNPYRPPQSDASLDLRHQAVRKRVSRPATALLIMSSIHAVLVTIHLVSAGFVYYQQLGSGISLIATGTAAAQLVSMIVISIGAAKLGFLESYRMARIGSILACIPLLTPFVWLGIPFGIWALRLLRDPEIRKAFPDQSVPDELDGS